MKSSRCVAESETCCYMVLLQFCSAENVFANTVKCSGLHRFNNSPPGDAETNIYVESYTHSKYVCRTVRLDIQFCPHPSRPYSCSVKDQHNKTSVGPHETGGEMVKLCVCCWLSMMIGLCIKSKPCLDLCVSQCSDGVSCGLPDSIKKAFDVSFIKGYANVSLPLKTVVAVHFIFFLKLIKISCQFNEVTVTQHSTIN